MGRLCQQSRSCTSCTCSLLNSANHSNAKAAASKNSSTALRYIILATWGIYPIAYMLPSLIDDEANAEVARQVMYSVGDVLAKPLFGILVLGIALAKSREDGYVEPGTTPSASDNANEPTNA